MVKELQLDKTDEPPSERTSPNPDRPDDGGYGEYTSYYLSSTIRFGKLTPILALRNR